MGWKRCRENKLWNIQPTNTVDINHAWELILYDELVISNVSSYWKTPRPCCKDYQPWLYTVPVKNMIARTQAIVTTLYIFSLIDFSFPFQLIFLKKQVNIKLSKFSKNYIWTGSSDPNYSNITGIVKHWNFTILRTYRARDQNNAALYFLLSFNSIQFSSRRNYMIWISAF